MAITNAPHLFEGLNPDQVQAVAHSEGPLLVVAGPGSGKTRVLTHRIANLVSDGVAPWQILALTFTNKAAGEMRSRVGGLVEEAQARDLWVQTFHSFCLRILRYNPTEAGLPDRFSVLDSSDAQKVIKEVLVELGKDPKKVRDFQSKISFAKNLAVTPDRLVSELGGEYSDVAPVMVAYMKAVHALGACDFDDILLRARKMLNAHPEIAEKYQKKFQYVLVDEFQDTNTIQGDIVRKLVEGTGNLCVVGDQDQAIYGWRGATAAVVDQFVADFPAATVVRLGVNYRSTAAIVDVSKAVIAGNPGAHRADLTAGTGVQGDPVRLLAVDTDLDEARIVAREMEIAVGKGRTGAIIVRTNAQTRVFEQSLMRANIKFQLVGAMRFFDRGEIKDALAWLKAVHNPWDLVSLSRAAAAPKRGLGPAAITKLIDAGLEANIAPADMLRSEEFLTSCTPKLEAAWRGFGESLDSILDAAATSPVDALRVLGSGTPGFKAYLEGLDRSDRDPKSNRMENFGELITAGEQFMAEVVAMNPDITNIDDVPGIKLLEMFLETVTLAGTADDEDITAEAPKANIVTAHAAKGKEWDYVWVVGLEEKLFPHARSLEDISEERRLFFVACSRAKTNLTISHAGQRALWGRPELSDSSRFLTELPDSVIHEDRVSKGSGAVGWGTGRSARSGARGTGYGKGGSYGRSRSGYGTGSGIQRKTSSSAGSGVAASRNRRSSAGNLMDMGAPVKKAAPAQGPRLSAEDVTEGMQVKHGTFGVGTITAISGTVADVRFSDKSRSLDLAFAPLEAL